MLLPQSLHVESNQSVTFKTQLGQMYGQGTSCKIFFKVSRTLERFSLTHATIFFTENQILPIPGGVLPKI